MQTKSGKIIAGRDGATLRYRAAGLAFVSELIHLWVLPGEFVISPLRGLFFVLAAACQGLLAVSLLFGPGKWVVRFGILLNVGIVAVWAFTRFVNFPAFPPLLGFTRLPVGLLDLAATAIEVALLVLLFRIARQLKRERQSRGTRCKTFSKTAERKEGAR